MFDSIFHDGLEGQRRHEELLVRRIVVHQKAVFKLYLLHGKIGAGVLQFFGKGNSVLTCNSGEVLAKIGGEIQCNLCWAFWGSLSQR